MKKYVKNKRKSDSVEELVGEKFYLNYDTSFCPINFQIWIIFSKAEEGNEIARYPSWLNAATVFRDFKNTRGLVAHLRTFGHANNLCNGRKCKKKLPS